MWDKRGNPILHINVNYIYNLYNLEGLYITLMSNSNRKKKNILWLEIKTFKIKEIDSESDKMHRLAPLKHTFLPVSKSLQSVQPRATYDKKFQPTAFYLDFWVWGPRHGIWGLNRNLIGFIRFLGSY